MKLEIPTTSYWHQLTNEEKREILIHPSCLAFYEHMQKIPSKSNDYLVYVKRNTAFLNFIEDKCNTIREQHEAAAEEKVKVQLLKQMFADFGV